MIKVALMCKEGKKLKVVDPKWDVTNLTLMDGSLMSTGDWVISEAKAKRLLGSKVVLCESRTSPSYVGGEIVSYVTEPPSDGSTMPRTTLEFRLERSLFGRKVSNWVEQNPVHYM